MRIFRIVAALVCVLPVAACTISTNDNLDTCVPDTAMPLGSGCKFEANGVKANITLKQSDEPPEPGTASRELRVDLKINVTDETWLFEPALVRYERPDESVVETGKPNVAVRLKSNGDAIWTFVFKSPTNAGDVTVVVRFGPGKKKVASWQNTI
jgi:hypothetical protein